ncbi:hypothetical protein AAZX31_17G097200 [Glycine max]
MRLSASVHLCVHKKFYRSFRIHIARYWKRFSDNEILASAGHEDMGSVSN